MNQPKEPNILKIGSTISIQHQFESLWIFSEGFVKREINLQNVYSENRQVNFSNCLFQVYPQFTNLHKTEALKKIKELQNVQKLGYENKKTTINTQQDQKEEEQQEKQAETQGIDLNLKLKQEIQDHQRKIRKEFKYNLDTFEKQKNELVTYSRGIQFLHLASNKYLAFADEEAELEKENFKLVLEDFPSDRTVFKIVPAFKYQRDGDQYVVCDESIQITNINQKLQKVQFIHINETSFMAMQQKGNMTSSNKNEAVAKSNKREVNVSLEMTSFWKIKTFSEYLSQEQDNLLKYGDIIWLHHSETNSSLSSSKRILLESQSQFGRVKLNDDFEKKDKMQCDFEQLSVFIFW